MPKFRYLPDIATADLAFEAFGKTYDELFENAGLALEEAMVKLTSVKPTKEHTINKEENSVENLLYSFLEELIFLKDAETLVFNRIKCEVKKEVRGWRLEVSTKGDEIDPKKHKLGVDVKAVTKHLFEIKQLPNKTFRCQIILDV